MKETKREDNKEQKIPECIYFEDEIPICATFEHGIGEWMQTDEYICPNTGIIQETVTCIMCGATDISYPM